MAIAPSAFVGSLGISEQQIAPRSCREPNCFLWACLGGWTVGLRKEERIRVIELVSL
jgi:hypothetical protein